MALMITRTGNLRNDVPQSDVAAIVISTTKSDSQKKTSINREGVMDVGVTAFGAGTVG